jgi:hypothetical protein
MSSWHQGKLFVEHSLSIDHDALHVIVGVLAWLALALVLRRQLGSWAPLLWLLALILWNETVDLWTEQWPDAGMQYGEGAKDVLLTMLLPILLMAAVRVRPQMFGTGRRRAR